jgi:MAF protein
MPALPPLILASASPRRRELLALGGWSFTLCAVDALEAPHPGETPEDFVQRLSATKAQLAAEGAEAGALVIGADTVVALAGRIIGKPANTEAAVTTLKQLRNRAHEVFTGLTVIDTRTGQAHTDLARSRVTMRNYSDAEIDAYVATGNPLDKAGAYAIQHNGFRPVATEQFGDCFANVMGLPLCHLLRRLRQLGLEPTQNLPVACQRFIQYQCPVFESILREEVT